MTPDDALPAVKIRGSLVPLPREFYHRTPWRSLAAVVSNVAIVVGAGPIAYALGSPLAYAIAFVLVGARAQSLYILQHECMHWLLFTNRHANNICGMLLSGLLGTELSLGRLLHFKHHRLTGRAEDPNRIWHDTELHPPGWLTLRFFAGQLAGFRIANLLSRFFGRSPAPPMLPPAPMPLSTSQRLGDLGVLASIQLLLLAAVTATSAWWVYVAFFLLPLLTLTSLFEAIRSFSEHVLPGEKSDSPAEQARLFFMDAGPIERFFISQFGFHYHHLHHLYPSVVTFKLKALHRWLIEHDAGYATRYARRDGYLATAIRYVGRQQLVRETT